MTSPAGRAGALRYWFSHLLLCVCPTNEITNRVTNICIGLRRLHVRFLFCPYLDARTDYCVCLPAISVKRLCFSRKRVEQVIVSV